MHAQVMPDARVLSEKLRQTKFSPNRTRLIAILRTSP